MGNRVRPEGGILPHIRPDSLRPPQRTLKTRAESSYAPPTTATPNPLAAVPPIPKQLTFFTTAPQPARPSQPYLQPTVQIPPTRLPIANIPTGTPLLELCPPLWDTTLNLPLTAFWILLSRDSSQHTPSTGEPYSRTLDSSIRLLA